MSGNRTVAEAQRPDEHSSLANAPIRSPQAPPQPNQAHG
jgi:hypothetical protein